MDLSAPRAQTYKSTEIYQSNPLILLQPYLHNHFTGRLTFSGVDKKCWVFYLHLGRVIWLDGGRQPHRQWQRGWRQHHLGSDTCAAMSCNADDEAASLEYHALVLLLLRRPIAIEQVVSVMATVVYERLFDLMQQLSLLALSPSHVSTMPIQAEPGIRPSSAGILPQAAIVPIERLCQRVQDHWQQWVTSGLTYCDVNLAPKLVNGQSFQQQVSPPTSQKLAQLLNGRHTLRDLASLTGKSVGQIARLIMPYVHAEAIALVSLPDIPRHPPMSDPPDRSGSSKISRSVTIPATKSHSTSAAAPLIACIEDNPQIQRRLGYFLKAAGYRFLPITDATKVVSHLLQYQPDVVLLDVVMPIVNGYEVCAQIRRVSALSALPVLMLTGQDGLVDRVRAKVVGATGFLSKTYKPARILKALAQHTKHSPVPMSA